MKQTGKVTGVLYAPPEAFEITVDAEGRPINPRGEVRDTTDLQQSIKEAGGIVEPILAYQAEDGRLHVRNGHRRVAAARIMGLDSVPYVLVSGEASGQVDALDIMLASNVHQAFPTIVLAKDGTVIGGVALAVVVKLTHRDDGISRTRESLARLMGVRPDVVSAYEQLVTAPVKVRKAVAAGRLSLTAFSRMKHAPADVQEEIVGDGAGNGVTVNDVRDGLRQAKRERQPQMSNAIPEEASVVEQLNGMINRLRLILDQPFSPREQFLLAKIHDMTKEVDHE